MALDVTRIRAEFPAFEGSRLIHLDNPAGTQVPRRVVERISTALTRANANYGGAFRTSVDATALCEAAHGAMADLLNAESPDEIVFGANMTTLAFMLSRTLGLDLEPGDEIIVGRMEHDANVSPWRRMAEDRGLTVRVLDFDPATCCYDVTQVDRLLNERTRFAAISLASNLTGTVNDVAEFCRRVRKAGALSFIDAVHYAPHGPVDVRAIGCDFLVCSPYKFFGPHQGVLYARRAVLERLKPYKLRASSTEFPVRFETGTQSLAGQSGVLGAVEYLEWIGATFAPGVAVDPPLTGRRATLRRAMTVIADYERTLSARLLDGLRDLPGVRIHGITVKSELAHRVPTVSISKGGANPETWAGALAAQGICVWSGHSYAIDVVERLGLAEAGGVLRIGAVHYNTIDEIDRATAAIGVLSRLS